MSLGIGSVMHTSITALAITDHKFITVWHSTIAVNETLFSSKNAAVFSVTGKHATSYIGENYFLDLLDQI